MQSDYRVKKYNQSYYQVWNDFVSKSKNATFLFNRDFLEYHSDRFLDFSLLIFKKNVLVALLPANKVGNSIHSHQGLTYGGLILNKTIKFKAVLNSVYAILKFLDFNKIKTFYVKPIPSIYKIAPSDELDYLLFILKAELLKKETLSVISEFDISNVSKDRILGLKRAQKQNLIVKETEDFELFWNSILIKNIKQRYGVAPVHSLKEILELKAKFPEKIKLFGVYKDRKLVAGTVIFESKNVAHSQYISADLERSKLGSLDVLHFHLLSKVYKSKLFFDFGSSNINEGKQINFGVQSWKEGFGARTVAQSYYKVDVKKYNLLEAIFK